MNRKVKIIGIVIMLVLCVMFPLLSTLSTAEEPWLDGWEYRISHNIEGNGGILTNYQMNFTVYNTSGISSDSTVYTNGSSNSDFSDLRFTTYDKTTLMYHHIINESIITDTSCQVYVKIPTINATTTTMYIYYGNSTATDISDPYNVYDYWAPMEKEIIFRINTVDATYGGFFNGDIFNTTQAGETISTYNGTNHVTYGMGNLTFRARMTTDASGRTVVGWANPNDFTDTAPDGAGDTLYGGYVSGRTDGTMLYHSRVVDEAVVQPNVNKFIAEDNNTMQTFRIDRRTTTTDFYQNGTLKWADTHADVTGLSNTIIAGTSSATKGFDLDWICFTDNNGVEQFNLTFDENDWVFYDEFGADGITVDFNEAGGYYTLTSNDSSEWGKLANCGPVLEENQSFISWADFNEGSTGNAKSIGVVVEDEQFSDANIEQYLIVIDDATATNYSFITGNGATSNREDTGDIDQNPALYRITRLNGKVYYNVSDSNPESFTETTKYFGPEVSMFDTLHTCSETTPLDVYWVAHIQANSTMPEHSTYNAPETTSIVANAGDDYSVDLGNTHTFDGSLSEGVDNYTWTFTDGVLITLYGISPNYTFSNSGTFNITLNASNDFGNYDEDWVTIIVENNTTPTEGGDWQIDVPQVPDELSIPLLVSGDTDYSFYLYAGIGLVVIVSAGIFIWRRK